MSTPDRWPRVTFASDANQDWDGMQRVLSGMVGCTVVVSTPRLSIMGDIAAFDDRGLTLVQDDGSERFIPFQVHMEVIYQ